MTTTPAKALLTILHDAFTEIKNSGGSFATGVSVPKKDLLTIAQEAEILPLYQKPSDQSQQ